MTGSGRGLRALLLALAALLVLTGCPTEADPGPQDLEPSAGPGPADADETDDAEEPDDADEGPSRSVTLAFAGDVHFEGGVAALLDDDDATLGPMAQALRTADVAVVNLESALTSGGSPAAKELEDPALRYWFRSPPSALDVLERSGVDVVSLANNHGADYGETGLRDSLRAARDSAVGVIGVGRDPAQAFRPFTTSVDGVDVAVLAADASPLESNASIWDVGSDGPGLAAARDDTRLLAAVRRAAASSDVVAVYLHWGAENVGCPTGGQRELAQNLADAGADVVVGSHTHIPLGAGMLDDTYVSYGLGNFLWYHGRQSETGVLRVKVVDGQVVRDRWVPGEIRPEGGPPRLVTGSARRDAVEEWRSLRGCTNLAPGPSVTAAERASTATDDAGLPDFASSTTSLPAALRRRMTGSSHDSETCPVDLDDLRLLRVSHVGFDGAARTGQLVVHRRHARDLASVFAELYDARFPIRRLQLVDDYGGDDNRSMAANNSSAYNCRAVAGSTSFSDHAYGAAVDLNPVENPYLTGGDVLPPAGRRFVDVDRSVDADAARGVIVDGDVVVRAFARIGWGWGGDWADADYQHFYAP